VSGPVWMKFGRQILLFLKNLAAKVEGRGKGEGGKRERGGKGRGEGGGNKRKWRESIKGNLSPPTNGA